MAAKQHKELWRTLKFVLFSMSAGIIELLSFTLFNELVHLQYWFSYLTALVLSVLWNFTLNRRFTFKSASNARASGCSAIRACYDIWAVFPHAGRRSKTGRTALRAF